mgnify:CR=1 FL=1
MNQISKCLLASAIVFTLGLSSTSSEACWSCSPDGGGGAACVSTIPYGGSYRDVNCNPVGGCDCQIGGFCEPLPRPDSNESWLDSANGKGPDSSGVCDSADSASLEKTISLSQIDIESLGNVHSELERLFLTMTQSGKRSIRLDSFGRGLRSIHAEPYSRKAPLRFEYVFYTLPTPDGAEFIWQYEGHPELARLEAELFIDQTGTMVGGAATVVYLKEDRSVDTLIW